MARETVQWVVAPELATYALLLTGDARRRWRRVAATVKSATNPVPAAKITTIVTSMAFNGAANEPSQFEAGIIAACATALS